MKNLKIISDFDGIWTNQEEEAEFVRNYYLEKLSSISGLNISELENLFGKLKSDMNLNPYLWGWFHNNMRACYYLEDPFGDNNAVFHYIERIYNKQNSLSKEIRFLRTSILNSGYETMDTFSNEMFFESTSKFKEENRLNPHEDAKSVVDELLGRNINIVVASNSRTNKIEYLFDKMGYGISYGNSDEELGIYARGNAMKFVIDNNFSEVNEKLEIDKYYQVQLRRKHYFEILKEEKPDFVIGDVFSLDIALPLYLAFNNPEFQNLKVIQKLHPHTPSWVKEFIHKPENNGKVFMINKLSELPILLSELI